MRILVFNSGSSSLKFQLFEAVGLHQLQSQARGAVRRFGPDALWTWKIGDRGEEICIPIHDHQQAAGWIIEFLEGSFRSGKAFKDRLLGTGHRVVHGGGLFLKPVQVTDEVFVAIESLESLAPLHNRVSLEVMRVCQDRLGPDVPRVAVFDTSFHCSLPEYASSYALPSDWTGPAGIKRFGFHGIAHQYIFERYLQICGAERANSRVITLQLGHGCSMAAVRDGRSVETSMGFTPMEGLIMATRPGDVDPGILLHLIKHRGLNPDQLQDGLNHRSGLLGLSGVSSDLSELLGLEAEGHAAARLAVDAFCHRVRKYLGAYLAVLGGTDAVLFGGGIGEHAPEIRERICSGMAWCGLVLDAERNRMAKGVEALISMKDAPCRIYVIPVDEESVIARETYLCLSQQAGKE